MVPCHKGALLSISGEYLVKQAREHVDRVLAVAVGVGGDHQLAVASAERDSAGGLRKPAGGPRRPLLAFRRPCQRMRRWYP
jgi:hypothetical protein